MSNSRCVGLGLRLDMCETPKSPPGDYNACNARSASRSFLFQCETPKSPPGDYNSPSGAGNKTSGNTLISVKHLNPRQGITTAPARCAPSAAAEPPCVKHLNPRQGITTSEYRSRRASVPNRSCETPKSPPGDYNVRSTTISSFPRLRRSV